MTDTVLHYAANGAILLGTLFVLLGVVGFFRFPDFYTRLHAATVTDTAGAGLFVLGLALHTGFDVATLKLAFILLFSFFTSPTGSYAVANSAVRFGLRPWTRGDRSET